jgi:hypothetical protein
LNARALFIEEATGGGLVRHEILETLVNQYLRLKSAGDYDELVLWFDACLFDQSMLAHILACLEIKGILTVKLICVDAFPEIVPYNGLGQLRPDQLASVYPRRQPVTADQFCFAERVDSAFALQDISGFIELSDCLDVPLPWIPAAVKRWLKERPDEATGLGQLERLALEAILSGCTTPAEIFASVAAHDTPPQYWGDITLWAKINGLATRRPALVRIDGPTPLLPQWNCAAEIGSFRILPLEN